jgi:hypothetical protein
MGDLIERLRPLAGSRNSPTWIYAPIDSTEGRDMIDSPVGGGAAPRR